jgi:hypothetical protein
LVAPLETGDRFLHFFIARFERSTREIHMSLTPFINPDVFHTLIHPASAYQSPDDVLRDETLSVAEKRVVLSSWASDAHVVEAQPWLRQIPGADHPVRLAAILAALRSLDGGSDDPPPKGGMAIRLSDLARINLPVDCMAQAEHSQPMRRAGGGTHACAA